MARISVNGLKKTFCRNGREVVALDGVDLVASDEEFVAVLGPSGCGKTTLLQIIDGIEKPDGGEVRLDGEAVERPGLDRGLVFQEYSLFPWLTVRQNIEFGLEIKGAAAGEREEISNRWLSKFGLSGFENAYPYELSGGMKQRVAIARVFAFDPEVLLMDEPFAALDAQTRAVMQEHLLEVWSQSRKTVIFATHSIEEAVFLADRVVLLTARPGRVEKKFNIDLPRPRKAELKLSLEFVEMRHRIWDALREEVRM